MPEDATTVERLVERTKENLREGLIVVLHFNDPSAAANPYDVNPYDSASQYGYGSATPSTSVVMQIATAYSESEKHGGRPLIVLQIDRDEPGMDAICAQRGVMQYPTIQVYSRGDCSTVLAGELEQKLLQLGVASRTRPGRPESSFGAFRPGVRAGSSPAGAATPRDVKLSPGRASKAADDSLDAPVEAVLMEQQNEKRSEREERLREILGKPPAEERPPQDLDAKLDKLFGAADDDDDMLPPI